MNAFLALLGIESWKPVLGALALPPVPFLLLILVGARLMLPRRGWGWFVILLGLSGLWLSACSGTGYLLTQWVLTSPPALSATDIAGLKTEARNKHPVAIVVLGSGVERLAPEYSVASLQAASLERLRYGLWLNRESGVPVAFSGGIGWAQREGQGQSEAQVAASIAQQDFGRPLKWLEDQSRDTRENAVRSIALLKGEGIRHIVLVTHGTHMPRALRDFETAARGEIRIQPAPMGLASHALAPTMAWLPSTQGFEQVRRALHELLGLAVGV